MNNSDVAAYKDLFVQTAQDYIRQLNEALQHLAVNSSNQQAVADIHLAAHSLKSQNLAMGFETNGRFFLAVEQLFAGLKEEKGAVSRELQHDLSEWITTFKLSIEQFKKTGTEMDLSPIQEQVAKYLQ